MIIKLKLILIYIFIRPFEDISKISDEIVLFINNNNFSDMKKFLLLFLGLAIAASASAGFPVKRDVRQGLKTLKSITERTTKRHASGMRKAPITTAPEGEVKYYKRSGSCLYAESGSIIPGDQEGTIELTYAADNKVWFKNIFYGVADYYGDSYVYGTLSDDGNKITVPMGQSIYYSDTYSADVVLSWGTSVVTGTSLTWTPDDDVSEAVYVVEGNTIKLQGGGPAPSGSDYPAYEGNGLGSVWTDDGSFGGFLEWGTVLTGFIPATLPTNVTVSPDATSADVAWNGADGDNWNLRWRPWTDTSNNPHFWDLAVDTYESQLDGWMIMDEDGDGYNWNLAYSDDSETDACFYSESYSGGTALSPDNYLITPNVPLKGELRFTLWGKSDSWPDTLQVYAVFNEDLENKQQLFDEDLSTTAEHKTYTVDLSAFGGAEGRIAFRHYNCTDQYVMYLDDIFIGDPADAVEPAEWIYANNLTATDYTIEGLTPDTKYEVQVQASHATDAEAEPNLSDWTELLEFTTLANAEGVTVSVAAAATDGEYNYATLYYSDKNLSVPAGIKAYTATVAGGELMLNEISGVIPAGTAVVLKTDAKLTETTDFQFTEVAEAAVVEADNMLKGSDEAATISGEGSKYYMLSLNGSSEENSVGFYFDKGSNGGTQLKNGAHKAYLAVPDSESAVKGYTFRSDDATGIRCLTVSETSDANKIYDLQGRRVVSPENGIYIVNGKKIVVK